MNKIRGAAIGFGIGAGVIAVVAFYVLNQESAETAYVSELNRINNDLRKLTNEINNIGMDVSTKRISITQARFSLSTLVDDASRLHEQAARLDAPERYKSAHPHLVQGLDYVTRTIQSTERAYQYTDNALQASQQFEASLYTSIIGAIFGFGSLPSLSGMADVYTNTEAAKAAYNDAVRYSRQAQQELMSFYSLAPIEAISTSNFDVPIPAKESPRVQGVTKEMLEECKELGIPEFTCSEEQILAKKRLLAAQQGK